MPATATGRGAQIVIDPVSDTAKAVRGAYAMTMEANALKAFNDAAAGTAADGSGPDGRTATGGKATDFVTTPSASQASVLYVTGVSVGNGADLTEDVLQTYDIPANTLRNVGDAIHIFASGTFAGTTDTKQIRVKFGGTNVTNASASLAGTIRWGADGWVVKTGSGAQSYGGTVVISGTAGGSGPQAGTISRPDTAAITVQVTGQNTTTSTAGSVTCQVMIVQYFPAV